MSAAQFAVATLISRSGATSVRVKISVEDADALKSMERFTILGAIDKLWQEHCSMDGLRSNISLRAAP